MGGTRTCMVSMTLCPNQLISLSWGSTCSYLEILCEKNTKIRVANLLSTATWWKAITVKCGTCKLQELCTSTWSHVGVCYA